jgi:hypothetical protein
MAVPVGHCQEKEIIMSVRRRAAGLALALTLAGSAAAVVAAAVPASADTGGNPSLQYCRSIAQFYPGNITGPCTGYLQSHNFAGAAATNEYICKTEFVPIGEFATVGECVSALNGVTGS